MKMKSTRISLLFAALLMFVACTKKSDKTPDDESTNVDKTANLKIAGASANDLLSNENFDKLKIEIAYVSGFKPTQEAMSEFVDYIKLYTFKEDIEMVFLELSTPDDESLTIQEIADLETENRTVYNDGTTLGIYIYFTNVGAEDDDPDEGLATLGAVYRNTSMVIHEATVKRLAGQNQFISVADVEIATLNHEFGHLFGLVNLGTTPVTLHEDSESPNHCNIPGCLMRANLQFVGTDNKSGNLAGKTELKSSCSFSTNSVLEMFSNNTAKGNGNAVPLDSRCIQDLQSNGGR